MQLEAKKHLADALAAVDRILRFTHGRSLVDYRQDDFLRAAVERQFVTTVNASRTDTTFHVGTCGFSPARPRAG